MIAEQIAEQLAKARAMRARAEALRCSDAIGELGRRRARMLVTELRGVELALVAVVLTPILERLAATYVVVDEAVAGALEATLFNITLNGGIEELERAVAVIEQTLSGRN